MCRTRKTNDLYEAAFYVTFGGTIEEIEGIPYKRVIQIKYPAWVDLYKRFIGLVNYRKFRESRRKIKSYIKRRDTRLNFSDIAVIKPFKR